jgi:hypothetical protein
LTSSPSKRGRDRFAVPRASQRSRSGGVTLAPCLSAGNRGSPGRKSQSQGEHEKLDSSRSEFPPALTAGLRSA